MLSLYIFIDSYIDGCTFLVNERQIRKTFQVAEGFECSYKKLEIEAVGYFGINTMWKLKEKLEENNEN